MISISTEVRRQDLRNPLSFLGMLSWYQRIVGEHSQRTSLLARRLASALHLSEQETFLIGLAALIHDIGKIAIPSALLNKPGPLTEEEWVLMRRHSQIGAHLLQSAGGTWARASGMVLAHHERWDGHGYPDRKAGEAIPVGARIVAVVDAYVAMTESRPYRQALKPAEARAEIQRCAGSAFDPHIATIFLQVLERESHQASLSEK